MYLIPLLMPITTLLLYWAVFKQVTSFALLVALFFCVAGLVLLIAEYTAVVYCIINGMSAVVGALTYHFIKKKVEDSGY